MCAKSCATRAITEVLRKVGAIPLYTCCGRCVAVGQCAVDNVEATLPLIQPQLEVGSLGIVSEVHSVPFDVKDAVWRGARYRREDTTPVCPGRAAAQTCIGAQIVPVREDGVRVDRGRWQAFVGEGVACSHELRVTVGRDIDRVVGLVIQGERERQCHGGYLIVSMVAGVGRAGHNATAYLSDCISRDARCRGCRRRWRGACRRRGGWRGASCR